MGYESRHGLGPANQRRHNARMEELQDTQRIREFAARITDEAHFQQILDDCQTGTRDEVERRIRPYLRFPHVLGPGAPLADGTPTVIVQEYVPAANLHVIPPTEPD